MTSTMLMTSTIPMTSFLPMTSTTPMNSISLILEFQCLLTNYNEKVRKTPDILQGVPSLLQNLCEFRSTIFQLPCQYFWYILTQEIDVRILMLYVQSRDRGGSKVYLNDLPRFMVSNSVT